MSSPHRLARSSQNLRPIAWSFTTPTQVQTPGGARWLVSPNCRDHAWGRHENRRQGSASALGIVLLGVMAVLLGMTVDLGYIHVAQSELRRTTDASALAACWALFDAKVSGLSEESTNQAVIQSADSFSSSNVVAQSAPRVSGEGGDVLIGHYDIATNQFTSPSPFAANAVQVRVHRQHHANGEIPLFFGSLLGRQSQPMSATSVAALVQAIDGFHTPGSADECLDILPFALDVTTWQAVLDGDTPDSLSWTNNRVASSPNGHHECNLYPQGTGSPGNRGTVDIGAANNSTKDLSRQIVSGITRNDLLQLQSPLQFNEDGELYLNGDTGISAGVKDELQSIIGQKRIIPIFSEVNGNGNNAVYTIVKFAGVRILDVKLTGRMSDKRLIVEPAPVVARYARLRTDATSTSDYVYSPVMLVN